MKYIKFTIVAVVVVVVIEVAGVVVVAVVVVFVVVVVFAVPLAVVVVIVVGPFVVVVVDGYAPSRSQKGLRPSCGWVGGMFARAVELSPHLWQGVLRCIDSPF